MEPVVDIIILSNTANVKYYCLLEKCINSLKDSNDIKPNIIVVESNTKLRDKKFKEMLKINTLIFPDQDFNYNKFVNIGLEECKNEAILITNNDVFYEKDTLKILYKHLETYDSVSPWDNNITPKLHSERGIYEGYKIRYNVAGYSILTTRSTLNTIGNFDEKFSFWYADDDYAMSLKANKLRHALIGSASVFHAVEQSHGLFNEEERIKQTTGAKKIFEEKWK